MEGFLRMPERRKRERASQSERRKKARTDAMDQAVRTWTDERDGRTWTIRAFWSRDALMMAELVFECARESYETWWVSRRNLPGLRSVELEHLLDEARGTSH